MDRRARHPDQAGHRAADHPDEPAVHRHSPDDDPYQPDTGDNNINAMFKLGTIREGFTVNHRLTDPLFWCFKTNVPDGLKHFVRKAISGGVEGDFETASAP